MEKQKDLDIKKETSLTKAVSKNDFIVEQQFERLTPEQIKQVESLKEQIDFDSSTSLINYGSNIINKRADITNSILEKYKNKDIGEIGEIVGNLVIELRSYDIDQNEKGLMRFFKRTKNKIEGIRTQYEKANKSVKVVSDKLEGEIITLLNDINLLDKIYVNNLEKFKEHTVYIIAGKQKLEEVRNTKLLGLKLKAEESNLPEDAEEYKQLEDRCNNFEKYLHNLIISRMLCLLSLPRIKGIQNSNEILVDKIRQTIQFVMPLWKDSIAEAIISENTRKALDLQNQVDNATNMMLRKIVDQTKVIQIETAKASQRGIVDKDTIKYIFEKTAETMQECREIIQSGKEEIYNTEKELSDMESEYSNTVIKDLERNKFKK